jgi:predicted RNA-binding Zn-ribbon protein involved in translation (DUF1610 family)
MKQPKQILNEENNVKFICSSCGDSRIEAVLDGSHTTKLVTMFKGGGIEYGDTESNGDLQRFQCVNCGYAITDGDEEYIIDDDELVKWIEKNCKQE